MNRVLLGAAAAALTLFACADTTPRPAAAPSNEPQKGAPAEPKPGVAAPTAAVLLTHEVRDYDAWRAVFDEHAAARKRAGIKGAHVNRSADRPNVVTVYLVADSIDTIGKFLSDPDLKSTMQRAGVVSAPAAVMITPVEDHTLRGRPLPALIVKHKVTSFDTWKQQFDAHSGERAKAGIIGHAVNRVTDSPETLVVYLQAETIDSLRQFSSSESLKNAMMKAGVQGPPELVFVQGQK
jgi:hypothetical protein